MEFAHPGDDRLSGLFVENHLERRVFVRKFVQGVRQLVLVGSCVGLNRNRYHRIRERWRLQDHGLEVSADRVAGERVLQPHRRADLPRRDFLQFLPVVRVHPQQPAHPVPASIWSRSGPPAPALTSPE